MYFAAILSVNIDVRSSLAFSNVIGFLLMVFRVIEYIFAEVEKHIEEGTLIKEYKMSALPSLYEHFVKLIKYLVNSKYNVALLFF